MNYTISEYRWNSTIDRRKKIDRHGQKWMLFTNGEGNKWEKVEIGGTEVSPIRGAPTVFSPWQGSCQKKPWEYEVTAFIPCLDTLETLPICIELLRLQTVRPFICIIDTGSDLSSRRELEKLIAEDVEVHFMSLHGVRHPSDYPAMAMDMAFAICRTEYAFATHADCFIRNRRLIEELLELCKTKSPVVGYQLTPRAHPDWEGMVSHTASLYHMPTMDKIGFGWSLRRLCNQHNIVDYSPDPMRPNWPDTEILGNYILRQNDITPHLIAKESNETRTLDENIDHFRSYTAAKLYSPKHYWKVRAWFESAKEQALERIEKWRNEENNHLRVPEIRHHIDATDSGLASQN